MAGTTTGGKRRKTDHARSCADCDAAAQNFNLLAKLIEEAISNEDVKLDIIKECGSAPLEVLFDRPEEALVLAKEKTYQWPFKDVPKCWLRLCEDASLLYAARSMRRFAKQHDSQANDAASATDRVSSMLTEVVRIIDEGISLSGEPMRSSITKSCFNIMAQRFRLPSLYDCPVEYAITIPQTLASTCKINRAHDVDIEQFQHHLNSSNAPVLLTGLIDDWPAISKWHDPRYLLQATLDGRRIALVEIGSSYADTAMRQALMPIGDFMRDYILDRHAKDIGYIAQHDLLGHVEQLSKDVFTPEICYTSPPLPPGSSPIDLELSPRRNVWIGPQGTKSPFHTDPDSNIYCQVVGYKYFRLISRDQGMKMYSRSTDAQGLDLSNQSKVTAFSFAERHDLSNIEKVYPLFAQAGYEEAILGPGECLYIPARCWHYAESLSTSIGVNFWWT